MESYEPTWESLGHYTVPQWFKDVKFGIFIHWGIYAVPAFGNEWYPRNMYRQESPAFEHHRKTWGPQSRFGYKDFIPMFKAEKWDPESWVELFKKAGARYIVPVAEHHDGFAMYDTPRSHWNAMNMGPQRDIIAELAQATRAAGLKFGVSTHRAFDWRYYTYADEFDTIHPEYADLYNPPHDEEEPASQAFLEDWFARTKELVDLFWPDVLWFDFGWHRDEFAPYRPQITAYYYNQALDWGKGVVLQYKDKFPDGVAVYDIERGKLDDIREHYWQTDTSVSYKSWGYVEDDEFKSVTTIVHDLVDIVSKNGNLLLNVGPRADGTIPEEAVDRLLGVGEWLGVNGEAIYGARNWHIYGEGKAQVVVGHLKERENEPLTVEDVRFTCRDDALYVICPGWPGEQVTVKSLHADSPLHANAITAVTMLGAPEPLSWSQDQHGLTIKTPSERPCEHAYTFKIELKSD